MKRKSDEEIKKAILRFFLEHENKAHSPKIIAKRLNSNWLTTRLRLLDLTKTGILEEVIVDDKVVGFKLRKDNIEVFKEVYNEKNKKK